MRQKILLILITLLTTATGAWGFEVTANGVNWTCTVIESTTNVKIKPTNRNAISGAVTIPGIVTNNTTDYTVTEIDTYAFDSCNGNNGNGNLTAVTIPASVTKIGSGAFYKCSNLATYSGGSGVTDIGIMVFQDCSNLTSFTIPNGVTSIGSNVFKGCGLTSITIPANVTTINDDAFKNCNGLTTVHIPATLTTINSNPFSGCSHLTAFTVDESHPDYMAVDGVLVSKDGTEIRLYPQGKMPIAIPAGVTTIGSNAFNGFTGLTSITIPAGVTTIKSNAFSSCENLASVTIPVSVTSIEDVAFFRCIFLTSVTIYAQSIDVCWGAFDYNGDGRKFYVFSNCIENYQEGGSSWYANGYAGDVLEIPAAQLAVSAPVHENPEAAGEYWCTYYHPAANVRFNTDDVTVYKAKINDAKTGVTLTEIEGGNGVIPAGQAVMLQAPTSGSLSMELTSDDPNGDYDGNELKGGSTVTAGYDAYTLAAVDGKMGFYLFNGSTLNPNKAHLEIPHTAGARTFYGFSGDDGATAIESIDKGPSIVDYETDAEWYSLDGRRLQGKPAKKGFYVKQGQKFIVK